MTIHNWVSLIVIVIGWAVTYGKLLQKINGFEKDFLDYDVHYHTVISELKTVKDTFVTKEMHQQCLNEINRRLDAIDNLEIGAQLAEIKTMLASIKERLQEK